jgi:hypothetical protein
MRAGPGPRRASAMGMTHAVIETHLRKNLFTAALEQAKEKLPGDTDIGESHRSGSSLARFNGRLRHRPTRLRGGPSNPRE